MSEMICKYMAHMGNDILVLDAARVSFGKETHYIGAADAGLNRLHVENLDNVDFKDGMYLDYLNKLLDVMPEDADPNSGNFLKRADFRLLHFLAEHEHLLPFRHPKVTLRCKVPLFVARQLGKHQVGLDWSEESRRYIDSEPEFWWPDKWRKRAADKKQGSSDEASECMHDEKHGGGNWATIDEYVRDEVIGSVIGMYNAMIKERVAPEQARMILPQNMMVNFVWTGSLLAWFHLYRMRTDPTTQKETKDFAEMVGEHMKRLYPVSWDALTTWRM